MKKYSSLKKFVAEAKRGEQFIYHTGNLAIDRQKTSIIDEAASLALDLYLKGSVELCQRRVAKNIYDYIAVRQDLGKRAWRGCYA